MRNLSRLVTCVALVACAACGGSGNLDQRSREALPSKSTTQMGSPAAANSPSAPTGSGAKSAVGSASTYGAATVVLALTVNGTAAYVLDLIEYVASLPPTSCSGSSCVWQGSKTSDPLDWKLTVSVDESSNTFTYDFGATAKADASHTFHNIVHGKAVPSGIPHRGTGSFTVDADQIHLLNPSGTDAGQLTMTYDNTVVGSARLDATFTGVNDNDHPGQKLNIRYTFKEDGAGGGDLDVAWRNLTSSNTLSLHSRWKAGGSGRGDVAVAVNTGTALVSGTASECWSAGTLTVTYWHSSDPVNFGADSGVVSACAYADFSAGINVAP